MQDPERALLEFAAAHRLVLGSQAQALTNVKERSARGLLDGLVDAGLLVRLRVMGFTGAGYVITPAGLAAVGSALPAPGFELRDLRHAVAAAWVSVRSQDGRFGGVEVRSARELIAHDTGALREAPAAASRSRPFGVRAGGVASPNTSGLQHPDALLMLHDGWAAVHVQLTPLHPARLAALLTAYGADERYGLIVFVVEEQQVAVEIETAAVSAGVATMTSVQWMIWN